MGGRRALHGEIDEQGTRQVENSEEIEIRREPEMIGHRCGDEPADEIARDIAGDIGRRRCRGIDRARMFAEIGECQGEGRGHAQALYDTQHCEHRQVWRAREQSGRDRQHSYFPAQN